MSANSVPYPFIYLFIYCITWTQLHYHFCFPPGGWYCNCFYDNHFWTGKSDRLQQALHVFGHQHHDQETREAEARSVQFPKPLVKRNMGVRHFLVRRGQHCALHRVQVLALRVEAASLWRRTWSSPPGRGSGCISAEHCSQWLQHPQQFMVRSRSFHATGLWHIPQVTLFVYAK